MKEIKKIGVLTSGGDAPGMNAAIRAITDKALEQGLEVVGVIGGYRGLIDDKLLPLTSEFVNGIVGLGGTRIYSDRCNEFKTEEGMQKAIATCKKNNIDALVAIGGDGTFRGATDMSLRGIPTIGVTGTIDNDITATDYTVGFDTAMNTVLEALDKFKDTCESHARCNVVEVMGRGAGDIAINAAIAAGATACVVPEFPYDIEEICAKINAAKKLGKRNFIVVVSEGVGSEYAPALVKKIEAATGVETKFARFAHIVRGGSPNLRDRVMASAMGVYAVKELLEGKSNLVICQRNGDIESVDINFALILDRMYKGKLKDGDLDAFTPEQVEKMKELAKERRAELEVLYNIATTINL